MKVILLDDVLNLGKIGDMVSVKDGYARNFLFPQKKAGLADEKNVGAWEHSKRMADHIKQKIEKENQSLKDKIESLSCMISRKVDESENLYGSVTATDILSFLESEGITADKIGKNHIQLEEPIKTLGVSSVSIKIGKETIAKLKVWVTKE
jgi:large subunit ribosomal protein L9